MKKIIFLVVTCITWIFCNQTFAQNKMVYRLNFKQSLKEEIAKNFQSRIYHAALDGKLTAYKDDSTTTKYNPADLKDFTKSEEVLQVHPDPNNPDYSYDSVIKHDMTEDQVVDVVTCCTVMPDQTNHRFTAVHRSYGLGFNMVVSGYRLGLQALFWFKYEDLASIMNPGEILTFRNAVQISDQYLYNDFKSASNPGQMSLDLTKYIKKPSLQFFNLRVYNTASSVKGVTAYEDNVFQKILTPEDIYKKPLHTELAQVTTKPDDPNSIRDSMISTPVVPDSIVSYDLITVISIKELSYDCDLKGISYLYHYTYRNDKPVLTSLYCIPFADISKAIGGEGSNFYKICYRAMMDKIDMYNKDN